MKTITSGRNNGIQWTLLTQLDFADDLALLSHNRNQMQNKLAWPRHQQIGLKINLKKTELIKINTTAQTPITVNGEAIKEVESFTYLGSVVGGLGGFDCDIKSRIGKARTAFIMLKYLGF